MHFHCPMLEKSVLHCYFLSKFLASSSAPYQINGMNVLTVCLCPYKFLYAGQCSLVMFCVSSAGCVTSHIQSLNLGRGLQPNNASIQCNVVHSNVNIIHF